MGDIAIGTLLFHLDPPQDPSLPASVRWGGSMHYQRQRDLAYNYELGAKRVPISPAHAHPTVRPNHREAHTAAPPLREHRRGAAGSQSALSKR